GRMDGAGAAGTDHAIHDQLAGATGTGNASRPSGRPVRPAHSRRGPEYAQLSADVLLPHCAEQEDRRMAEPVAPEGSGGGESSQRLRRQDCGPSNENSVSIGCVNAMKPAASKRRPFLLSVA